jgi:hypothetical protein
MKQVANWYGVAIIGRYSIDHYSTLKGKGSTSCIMLKPVIGPCKASLEGNKILISITLWASV